MTLLDRARQRFARPPELVRAVVLASRDLELRRRASGLLAGEVVEVDDSGDRDSSWREVEYAPGGGPGLQVEHDQLSVPHAHQPVWGAASADLTTAIWRPAHSGEL